MKTTLSDDVFYCFGFGMTLAGFMWAFIDAIQIWWIMGGLMIFVSPMFGRAADKRTKHTDGEFWVD